MKVFILVDSEGSACVADYGEAQGEFIRQQATHEAAAAIRGAREAGASEILINDGGFVRGYTPIGLVLHYNQLPSGIQIAVGPTPLREILDKTFDAAIILGIHAMAGVEDGVLAHTFSSVGIEAMWLNSRQIGEIGILSLVFGAYDIPVVMVSADEAGCREALECLGPIETAPTKRGLSTKSAISLHPDDACELIQEKTEAALSRLSEFEPLRIEPPYELRTDCYTEDYAQTRCERKSGKMVGPKSFVVMADDPRKLLY